MSEYQPDTRDGVYWSRSADEAWHWDHTRNALAGIRMGVWALVGVGVANAVILVVTR